MIGGNEIRSLAFNQATLDDVRRDYSALIDRVRETVPDAACLAVTPIDAARATAAGAELNTRPRGPRRRRARAGDREREGLRLLRPLRGHGRRWLAATDAPRRASSTTTSSTPSAPAGTSSATCWPTPCSRPTARRRCRAKRCARGADWSAPSCTRSTSRARRTRPGRARAPAGCTSTSGCTRSKKAKGGRVAVGLFGGSHIAAEVMPHRVRTRLQDRFGDAGRGLVAVDGEDPRLLVTGVERRSSGDLQISDGRHRDHGRRDEHVRDTKRGSLPGARFDVTFCKFCRDERFAPRALVGARVAVHARHGRRRRLRQRCARRQPEPRPPTSERATCSSCASRCAASGTR